MSVETMPEIKRHNILLIEDHQPNIMVATAMLDMLGYSYVVAMNGPEGMEKFKNHRFDVILMDIQMPVISGVETAKQIKTIEEKEGLAATPIIAMTAHFASGDMNQWEQAGIEDVIPKPFHPEYFSKMLAKYCKMILLSKEPVAQ